MSVRNGELRHQVLPMISIDEFSAKTGTDEEVIVVGFYCKEEIAAFDLDDFIDKGIIEVLSSEVSPNPDPDGYWMVFVEFRRKPSFWTKLTGLVKDIERLTTELEWRVRVYGSDQLYAPEDQSLRKAVPLRPEEYVLVHRDSDLAEYFEPSALEGFRSQDSILTFEGARDRLDVELVDWITREQGLNHPVLSEAKWNPLARNPRGRALNHMLGEGWTVTVLDSLLLIEHEDSDRMAIVRC